MKQFLHKTFGAVITLTLLVLSSVGTVFAGQRAVAPEWYGLGGAFVIGMVVNAANLTAMFTAFKTTFNKAFAEAQPTYDKIAMVVPSTAAIEVHSWLGAFPKMREWIGDRIIKNLQNYKWQIENKNWESTVSVDRNHIEDDTYGIFSAIVQSMGASAKTHPDEIVYALLNVGFTALGYDAKTFFATDHAFGSNKATGALTPTTYGAALASIRRIKDDAGKPLFTGSEKLTLVTGPELESTAKILLNNDFVSVSSGSTQNNIFKGSAGYVMSPQITSTTAWFIVVEYNGIKPLIFQERKKPMFTTLTKEDDENVFMSRKFLYGADSRDNAGYGLPQLAFGSTGVA